MNWTFKTGIYISCRMCEEWGFLKKEQEIVLNSLLHRRIILIWYKTRRLQVVIKIRLDLYLLVVCCSEQLLHNEHLSAGSLTKRWQKSKSYSSRSDHCRTWHVEIYFQVVSPSNCSTLVHRVINWNCWVINLACQRKRPLLISLDLQQHHWNVSKG